MVVEDVTQEVCCGGAVGWWVRVEGAEACAARRGGGQEGEHHADVADVRAAGEDVEGFGGRHEYACVCLHGATDCSSTNFGWCENLCVCRGDGDEVRAMGVTDMVGALFREAPPACICVGVWRMWVGVAHKLDGKGPLSQCCWDVRAPCFVYNHAL